MTDRLAAEVLSQYLDHLCAGHDYAETYVELCPDRRAELSSLLAFARRMKALLVPVKPSEQFVRNLHARLIAAPVAPVVVEPTSAVVTRERVLVGVAALGSLAALILVLTRGRVLGARAA